jgi:hypothetical protein
LTCQLHNDYEEEDSAYDVGETCLRTFEEFFKGVKDSCEGQRNAKTRHGGGGVDDDNQLATVTFADSGVSEHHAIGDGNCLQDAPNF